MCAFLTYFHSLAANHHPNVCLQRKKSGKHVAAATSEAFQKFCIFRNNLLAPRPQSRTRRKVHFGQGQHVCPGESWKWEKKSIFMYNKYRMVKYERKFGRGRSRRSKRRGRKRHGLGGRDARGHVVTCAFRFRLRSGRSR